MALEGGVVFIKCLMFLFNLLFVLSGLVICIIGCIVFFAFNHYTDFLKDSIPYIAEALIAIGLVILILSCFGCCGAIKENRCLMVSFSIFLAIIFIMEVVAGVAGFIKYKELDYEVERAFNNSIDNYYQKDDARKTLNMIQVELSCCGAKSYEDWSKHALPIPEDCCTQLKFIDDNNKESCTETNANLRREGCFTKLVTVLKDKAYLIGLVALGIAVVQLLGIIYACILARSISQNYGNI